MTCPFYTIGHGRRSTDEFLDLLRGVQADFVVDVRTVPRSRTNPQYNQDVLPQTLEPAGIGYEHIAALGGLRGKARDVGPSINGFWQNDSFHNYADYAMGHDFRDGLVRLKELGRDRRCAIMCAETVWWRCHRRIIADYLIAAGEAVFHILAREHVGPAKLTSVARLEPSGILTYPVASQLPAP
jgi:uncharacterized protein (DUF488 family)